jgi:CRISPR system Cascade subunit CasE
MTLTMVHLPISPRALFKAGRDHGLARDAWSVETGYLVHALFARLFGDSAPKPFDVRDDDGTDGNLSVFAYTGCDHAALARRARATGDAEANAAIAWRHAGSRAMPALRAEMEVGFRVRVCPTIRVGRHHPRFAHGAEVDPYVALVQRWRAERYAARAEGEAARGGKDAEAALPTREAVYRDWLAARMVGAAGLADVRLVSMRDARLWRKGTPGEGAPRRMYGYGDAACAAKPRPVRAGRAMLGRREAVFEGRLRVTDPAAFASLLARGVGRHRAFGFGMLLLRPAAGD